MKAVKRNDGTWWYHVLIEPKVAHHGILKYVGVNTTVHEY